MPDDFHSYQGKLLISNSSIVTDAFHKSVIFMIEHDKQGAFGLVVNKKTERKLFELVPALPFEYSYDVPIFWGGPVDHTFVSILHDHSSAIDPGIEVIPGVYISRSFELLNHIIKIRGCHFIILQGYSGWGSGQLESEFERKSWASHEVKPEFIFSDTPETIWKESLKSKGGIYKYFAEHTKDPMLN